MRAPSIGLAALLAFAAVVTAQDGDWKKDLESKLAEAYPLTRMDNNLFAGRTALKERGVVLIVKQDGIPATDGGGLMARFSRVRHGQVMNPQGRTGPGAHICKIGEEVLVRDINVDDDKIDFKLVTNQPIESTRNGTTRAQRYYAMVRFEFEQGGLSTASVSDVIAAVRPVLESQAETTAPKTIELGQTTAEVEAILGRPETMVKLGAKTIYTYKTMKVIFTSGKVTDVQ
jgi:hypothetical protein